MPYDSLGEFLAELQDNGELVRVSAQVDPALELAAIVHTAVRNSPEGGPALLFDHVKNSPIPVVANLLGSERRLCQLLGVERISDISGLLDQTAEASKSGGWWDSFRGSSDFGAGKWAPKIVKSALCQQVVRLGRDVDLWSLPIPRCWPAETHPVLTSGILVAPQTDSTTSAAFRATLAVINQQELGWYIESPLQQELVQRAIDSKQNLPLAISLGADPVLALSANFPAVGDSRSFAGLLRRKSMDIVRCRTNELEVPAGAEFVIEGFIDAANAFSNSSITIARGNGRYITHKTPLIQVSAVTHRANPVLPVTIVSAPPSEETRLAQVADRVFLPFVKRYLPEIVDLHQPASSANRNILFVSIRKTVEHQARRVLHALWGLDAIGQSKIIVIVDEDLDLRNEESIWFTVGTNACPSRDFVFSDGLARNDDYTSLSASLASRVGIDATRKRSQESNQPWPEMLRTSSEMTARIQERWAEIGIKERMKSEG